MYEAEENSLSLFLELHNSCRLSNGTKLFAECSLCLKNQLKGSNHQTTCKFILFSCLFITPFLKLLIPLLVLIVVVVHYLQLIHTMKAQLSFMFLFVITFSSTAVGTWFSSTCTDWGHTSFLPLEDVNSSLKGLMRDDCVIVQVKIEEMFLLKEMEKANIGSGVDC